MRCVINHFKWRGALLKAFRRQRGADSNFLEMARYDEWIVAHGRKVPSHALRPYSVEYMKDRGLPVEPTAEQIEIARLMNEVPKADMAGRSDKEAHLRALLGSIEVREGYASQSEKICFVTFELVGPMHTNGIGTAISATVHQFPRYGNPGEAWPGPEVFRSRLVGLLESQNYSGYCCLLACVTG